MLISATNWTIWNGCSSRQTRDKCLLLLGLGLGTWPAPCIQTIYYQIKTLEKTSPSKMFPNSLTNYLTDWQIRVEHRDASASNKNHILMDLQLPLLRITLGTSQQFHARLTVPNICLPFSVDEVVWQWWWYSRLNTLYFRNCLDHLKYVSSKQL